MSRRLASAVAIAIGIATASSLSAQSVGLLVVAHGANATWNDDVRQTVSQVRWNGPVGVAFLMGPEAVSSGWDSVTSRLVAQGAGSLIVVPLMVSSSGAHYRQIEYYAGLRAEMPPDLVAHDHSSRRSSVPITMVGALDNAPEIGEALAGRRQNWSESQRRRPILLVAHGPESDAEAAQWLSHLAPVEASLRAAGLRAEFRVALLRDDAGPDVKGPAIAAMRDTVAALAARASDSVMVVPVMIAMGPLTRSEIPGHLERLPVVVIAAGLTPHPAMARWIERVAGAAVSSSSSAASSSLPTAPSRP